MQGNWMHLLVVLSVGLYWILDFRENKQVRDERYELIQLKTFELLQKINMIVILLLAALFYWRPEISGGLIILAFILSSLYGEIFGREYFKRKY